LRLTSAPEGVSAEDQQVTVVADVDTPVTVTAQVAGTETPSTTETAAPTETATATETETSQPGPPANLVVELHDEADQGIGGACFTLEMAGQDPITSCDADDVNPGNGRTGFFGIPSGTYTLTESTVPAGTTAIAPQQVTIEPGDNPDLVVRPAQSLVPPRNVGGAGTVVIDTSAIGGSGICVELNTSGGIGFASPPSGCDNGDGDANDQPGIIEIPNVQPGQYVLSVVSGADGIPDQTIDVSDTGPTRVTLGQEQPTQTETVPPTQEPTTGTLTVTVADANGAVGGACVDVTNPSGTYTFCDDDDNNGTIEISDVVFGTQTIAMSTVPDGYRTPQPQTVELDVDQQSAEVAFTLEAAAGSIAVTVTDANGAPIENACVSVDDGEPRCTGADGTVTFENVPVGQHTVSETSLPDGYQALDPVQVTVEDGQAAPASFQHPVPTGAIQVTSVDPNGANIGGACVAIDGGEPLCDVDGDGILNFPDIPVGGHDVTQTTPPDGYQPADPASQKADVAPGQQATVTFTNAPATGGIAVTV
ncbi:MAG TPA: SpaA isopeptide-forming pilin-related protein, partial [Mycobacteriales bacterium]|nr:SpaA isopeptide-forming pilin-related protein [Mycobacteriales bacterium]